MKKAIIIGASSGIGKELARILAANNFKIGIAGRRLNLLKELAIEKPDSFIVKSFDISVGASIVKYLEEFVIELGGLDLLIICSGIVISNEKLDFQLEKLMIDTNVSGFTIIADWAFNYFQNQKSGHLVGVSSVGGLRGWRDFPAYNAGKAYQICYLEGLRNKAFHTGLPIVITDIRPGYVDTDLMTGVYKIWISPANKVATQIYRAIRNRKKIAYVTRRWAIIAFLLKIVPNRFYERG
ncbi:MAG: SDR family NAD(P)-dependent oxidoreductase [Bacteroidales bacterium]|nr:SDR family NAD(P)-dependent oxidoreductase [Lentimicrobiaceae bacterium]MDD5695165.1 SDR family NAD(P)-dependent oxidoreductase [Bacteroidales bacterium]